MIGALTNHLWQSTWFAAAAALLALALRKTRADIRFWLWLSASCKFLLPFAMLMELGGYVKWDVAAREAALPAVSHAVTQISQPFPGTLSLPASTNGVDVWTVLTISVWACGFLTVVWMRFRGWRRVQAAVRESAPMDLRFPVEVRSCPGLLEPGVVGLFRPVLLLPADIGQRLTPRQLDAVLAHELCHVRRRDNVTAAMHMIVEALFWFYPLVWWIGARLIHERERACDEEVLRLGNVPQEYAEGILNVCKSYVQSPLRCVPGVTGADLKARIHAILGGCVAGELNRAKRIGLAAAGIAALAIPIVVGMISGSSVRAQSRPPSAAAIAPAALQPTAPTAPQTARTNAAPAPGYLTALGSVAADSVTVKPRVEGQLMTVTFKEGDRVQAGQLLATIDPQVYQLQLLQAEAQLTREQTQLAQTEQAVKARLQSPADIAQLASGVEIARADVERAKLQLSYTQIKAPITGIIGLRQVDPGNIVRPTDAVGLAVINQVQPISVLFNTPQDNLPQVLSLLQQGANVPVEAWNRDATLRYATGRLTAVDNQIDQNTGTVKLRAAFENRDGKLFPNQFVVVHLSLLRR